jgi:cation transport ATPase
MCSAWAPRRLAARRQNLWWVAGYNIVAIPLAAGMLAPAGLLLSPAIGAVLMSLSTVIVAVNAKLLSRPSTHRRRPSRTDSD